MLWNMNKYIRVRLTDEGRRIHRANHEALVSMMPRPTEKAFPYSPPNEDEDGWSKWQGWHLMQQFGPWMRMGFNQPFDLTVDIVDE